MHVHVVYDVDGWAYHRRALALERWATPPWVVTHSNRIVPCDVLFLLLPELATEARRRLPEACRIVTGFNTSVRSPRLGRHLEDAVRASDRVVFNSRLNWLEASRPVGTTWIPNGIDLDLFRATTGVSTRPWKVLWCGSIGHAATKGANEIVRPLFAELAEHGVETELLLVDSHERSSRRTPEEMVEWYNGGTHYVVASAFEGTPNTALEAAACGCAVLTTRVGDMPDIFVDGLSAAFCERSVPSFLEHLLPLLERPAYERMVGHGLAALESRRWSTVAPQFFELFATVADHD